MPKHISLVILAALALLALVTPAAATPAKKGFKVRTSLDGKTVLPHRIHWLGYPLLARDKIKEVAFLIDGKVRWIEDNPPYSYSEDGGYLVTSWLSPGLHRFTVRATSYTGAKGVRPWSHGWSRRQSRPPSSPGNGRETSRTKSPAPPILAALQTPCPPVTGHSCSSDAGSRASSPESSTRRRASRRISATSSTTTGSPVRTRSRSPARSRPTSSTMRIWRGGWWCLPWGPVAM